MLKKNNKGFMLMETLLVSVFIASTLIFLYIQFQKVRDSYQSSFTYNTVIGTYASSNFLNYLQENGLENLSKTIDSGTVYIDLTTCPGGYLTNTELCKKLITDLGIKKVIYSSSDTTDLITRMNNSTDFSPKFKIFTKNIKVTNRISYRLLFEYDDETYSTILARSKAITPPTPTPTPEVCGLSRVDGKIQDGIGWNGTNLLNSSSMTGDYSAGGVETTFTGHFIGGKPIRIYFQGIDGYMIYPQNQTRLFLDDGTEVPVTGSTGGKDGYIDFTLPRTVSSFNYPIYILGTGSTPGTVIYKVSMVC